MLLKDALPRQLPRLRSDVDHVDHVDHVNYISFQSQLSVD
jgi:hypothetical protein